VDKSHKFSNKEIVRILKEVLSAMEVKGFNIFETRAYQNAVSAIDNLTTTVYDLWEEKRLREIPGVGATLESHLDELFKTGKVEKFYSVKKGLPEGMFGLIGVRGIGAKKALKLAMAFKLTDRSNAMEKVKQAAENGQIRNLESFGEKSEKDILNAITEAKLTKNAKKRLLLYQAEEISERLISYIKKLDVVLQAESLGSLRRRNATVGDIDIAISTNNSEKVIEHFMKYTEIDEVLSKGDKKVSVVLKNDIQVDLRTSDPGAFGSMMQYFTGSKQHNIILRTYSLEKGKSLSEYGITYRNKLHKFSTEEDFYKFLNMQYIPPELRHGKNEVELALKNKTPELVNINDIKGDFHTHTTDSDGVDTLEEMVKTAHSLGYKYYGISDHAPSVQSRGYKAVEKIIFEKKEKIKKLNEKYKDMKLFFGYEVNILADTTLALPDGLLKELDYVVASIHTSFDQDREIITKRIINSIENPYVTIIGHPTGRLINEREASDTDWTKVFRAAQSNDKIFEINSQLNRLDLTDDLVKEALEYGIKLIVNTDAHATDQLYYLKYGIDVARRGGCTKADIINSLDLEDFVRIIKSK